MGMILPLLVFVAFLGLNSTAAYYEKQLTTQTAASAATIEGENLIRYRDALTNYAAATPGFIGTVPLESLLPYLSGAELAAFTNMNNTISSAPNGGREIVSYLAYALGGAPEAAPSLTKNDAAIGRTDQSGSWFGYGSQGAAGVVLSIVNDNLVSVVIIN